MDQHDSVSYRKMGLIPTGDTAFAMPEQREGVDLQNPIKVGYSCRLGKFRNAVAIKTQGRWQGRGWMKAWGPEVRYYTHAGELNLIDN